MTTARKFDRDARFAEAQDHEDSWQEWYLMEPLKRWQESMKLWQFFLLVGGSLDPEPIIKVLSTLTSHKVRYLLMGVQACAFYGAAEFSRDCDIVILADEDNLLRLNGALKELDAQCIAVPPFELKYVQRGHAVHFRCQNPDAPRMRLDVMTNS